MCVSRSEPVRKLREEGSYRLDRLSPVCMLFGAVLVVLDRECGRESVVVFAARTSLDITLRGPLPSANGLDAEAAGKCDDDEGGLVERDDRDRPKPPTNLNPEVVLCTGAKPGADGESILGNEEDIPCGPSLCISAALSNTEDPSP